MNLVLGRKHLRAIGAAALAAALCATVGLAADADAAKKKKKTSNVFQASLTPNAAVPNVPAVGPATPVLSTLTVGKAFKGKVVGDVNVTGIRVTGSAAGAANDLSMMLTAPSGRSVLLINSGIGDQSFGPLTFDDDTRVGICDSATFSCPDPDASLIRPFIGTANMTASASGDTGPLSAFNLTRMKGTWTLRVWDDTGAATTNVFNSWGLKITAAKPVRA